MLDLYLRCDIISILVVNSKTYNYLDTVGEVTNLASGGGTELPLSENVNLFFDFTKIQMNILKSYDSMTYLCWIGKKPSFSMSLRIRKRSASAEKSSGLTQNWHPCQN